MRLDMSIRSENVKPVLKGYMRSMTVNILILVGTGDSLKVADELCLHAEFKVYIFLDKRSRLRSNSKVAGEISSLRNEEFFHRFLIENGIEALIDASHPFDKESTELCKRVSKLADIKLTHFLRPPWTPTIDDNWTSVRTLDEAAKIIPDGSNVFIATGRIGLEKFSKLTSSKFFIRRLGKVKLQCPLDNGKFIYGNPPFSLKDEISLFRSLKIDILVIKNVGGDGSFAKVEAARAMNISVIMIERPKESPINAITTIPEIFKWMDHNL